MEKTQEEKTVKPALPDVPLGPIAPTPEQAAFLRRLYKWQEDSAESLKYEIIGGPNCPCQRGWSR